MFWGLILKANRRYSQTLKKAFHLSNAALDISSCTDNELVQVVIGHDGHDYVLCNLRKNKVEQVSLDLTFKEGDEISFTSQGNGNVHLTGYLLLDDDFDELDEESDMEELPMDKSVKKEINSNKKKTSKAEKNKSDGNKVGNKDEDEEDDDEDDSDMDDDTFDLGGEEEEDDDDDEDEDEEEEDDESDESDDEVQQPKAKQIKLDKVQQNGIENGQVSGKETKKDKKKDKQKQPQNQQKQQQQQKQKQNQTKQDKSPKSSEKILAGGVRVEDVQVGGGPEAKPGKKVQVYYEGRLKQNNKVFDSTKEGKGFKFGLGKGEVIKGWDIGIAGMKVGGKRRITCPPHMAYGAKGHPPVIPPNSTLVFEVELKGVN